jgi:hypothetical protein
MNDGHERRKTPRAGSVLEHKIVEARVRPGHDVSVVNVSAAGALVDAAAHRLLPGTSIELQLATRDRRVSVRGRVLRCTVARLNASVVWYRAAIGFDRHLPWMLDDDRSGYAVLGAEMMALGARADASHFQR